MAHKRGLDNPPEIDVFTDNWRGSANQPFKWKNGTVSAVTVSQAGNSPFPFVVAAGGNSIPVAPGTQDCQLIGIPKASPYTYNVLPVPQEGNPKSVVIG